MPRKKKKYEVITPLNVQTLRTVTDPRARTLLDDTLSLMAIQYLLSDLKLQKIITGLGYNPQNSLILVRRKMKSLSDVEMMDTATRLLDLIAMVGPYALGRLPLPPAKRPVSKKEAKSQLERETKMLTVRKMTKRTE
jgi:hypothetical protein